MGKVFGRTAYEGYFNKSGGKSLISGQPLPTWDEQAPEIQAAWEAAAQSVVAAYCQPGNS